MNKRFLKHTLSLLNTDYVKLDARWNYKNVISPYHRIYYIDAGEGKISDTSKTLNLEAGYLYIIPSYTLCNLVCESYLSQYFVQFFEESADGTSLFSNVRLIHRVKASDIDRVNFRRLIDINPGRGINRSDNPQVYEKNIYYKAYQELNNYQKISDFLETQGILFQLLSRFTVPEIFQTRQEKIIPAKILETMRFVYVNLHLPLNVKLLAERVNLNSEYFSRLFEKHTGTRPLSFISETRIERAVHVMATSRASISEIASLTGFESLSHFTRTFKKVTGRTPGMYRKQIYHASTEE
ncbi:helix-turn-helix domain-containing protein [Dyadobacter pollutisoli]|uniref:AraC family transcriptional regulator n=1 Tax=Dyadobacter pollutisoli TaxID=2910158 RepID=A0A9E8NDV8_9BACT|nr:AraC family transcriptional regulator [Dyadobacter pollutisoli]WAC13498.1 AraC family transcriptional regulator [Dyadobacter pollutisoli]